MNYNELNDNELVYLCQENNEEAENKLIEKYKGLILGIIKEYISNAQIKGLEISDLYQEGLLGLLNAIKSFSEVKDTTFYTYALTCIKASIISEIRRTLTQKNKVLNESYSLDNILEESEKNFYELFKDEGQDPNIKMINAFEFEELVNDIKSKLSKSEIDIFELKLQGYDNQEIAKILKRDKKYVENTIFRINKKYKERKKEQYV